MQASSSNSAIQALRDATRNTHEDLEASLQVLPRLRSPVERPALVRGYRRMLGGAAASSELWLGTTEGIVPSPVAGEPGASGPALGSRAEALGFHYVMAGSALGGRVMLRELERNGVDTTGFRFLAPHGARTGEVWRLLLGALERELTEPETLAQAVTGARKGFAFARSCLESHACLGSHE